MVRSASAAAAEQKSALVAMSLEQSAMSARTIFNLFLPLRRDRMFDPGAFRGFILGGAAAKSTGSGEAIPVAPETGGAPTR